MKLSKFIALSQKAIDKYGDMDFSVYSACDSYDITDGSDAWQELSLRVIRNQALPGESLEEEDQSTKKPEPTAVLFYS